MIVGSSEGNASLHVWITKWQKHQVKDVKTGRLGVSCDILVGSLLPLVKGFALGSLLTGRLVLSCCAMLRAAPCRAAHSSAHMTRQKAPDPLPGVQRDRWSK